MGCCHATTEKVTPGRDTVIFDKLIPSNDEEKKSADFRGFFKQRNTERRPKMHITNSTKSGIKSPLADYKEICEEKNNIQKESPDENEFSEEHPIDGQFTNAQIGNINYPILELSVGNTKTLIHDTIKMTPMSITSSQGSSILASANEKFSFGSLAANSSMTTCKNYYNFSDDGIGELQFEIWFEDAKFYVIDKKKGTGLFVKIKDKVIIDRNIIVSFCSSHMILQVDNGKSSAKEKIIRVRFFQGATSQSKEKTFSSQSKTELRLGRSKDADIIFKDESISRVQCTLMYENSNWVLYDGHFENGNRLYSTNGIWLLASLKIELISGMTLKAGNVCMETRLIQAENE